MFSSLILKPRPLCACKYFQDISRSSRPPSLAHVTEPGRCTPPSVAAPLPTPPSRSPARFPSVRLSSILSVFSPCFPRTAADPVGVTRGDLEMITPDEPWMRGNLTTLPWELQAGQAGIPGWSCDRGLSAAQTGLQSHCGSRSQRAARRGAQRNGSQCRCIIDEIHCDVSPGGRSKAK